MPQTCGTNVASDARSPQPLPTLTTGHLILTASRRSPPPESPHPGPRVFYYIDNLLIRIHFIIEMIWWTGLAPWEFESPFPGSLTSTFLVSRRPLVTQLLCINIKPGDFLTTHPDPDRCGAQFDHQFDHHSTLGHSSAAAPCPHHLICFSTLLLSSL